MAPPNRGGVAPAHTKHATMPIFVMDGPHRTTTNLTGAIFWIRPLGRDMVFLILFFDLGVSQTYPHISAQAGPDKAPAGPWAQSGVRGPHGPLKPLHWPTWESFCQFFCPKNLEIGVSTKLIVTARIRGNVLLKSTSLHIYKKLWKKNLGEKFFWKKKSWKKNPKVQSPTERPFRLRARNLVTMSVF